MMLIGETLLKGVYNIPYFYMSAVQESKPSESSFYSNLLQAVKIIKIKPKKEFNY